MIKASITLVLLLLVILNLASALSYHNKGINNQLNSLNHKMGQNSNKNLHRKQQDNNEKLREQIWNQLINDSGLQWIKQLENDQKEKLIDIIIKNIQNEDPQKDNLFTIILNDAQLGPIVAEHIWTSGDQANKQKVEKVKKQFKEFKDWNFDDLSSEQKIQVILALHESGMLEQIKQ